MTVTPRLRAILIAVEAGAVLVASAILLLWIGLLASPALTALATGGLPIAAPEPTFAARAILVACAAPALLPAVLALSATARLARTCRMGHALTEAAAQLIRRLGALAALAAVGGIVSKAAASAALSALGPGTGTLVVQIGTGQVALLLGGGLLAALGAAMSEAARASEENRGFV